MSIVQGLTLEDLDTIHEWMINDYDITLQTGLLHNFMMLVKNAKECWGLYNRCMCIGFAYVEKKSDHLSMELFSIHPEYRKRGLGRRFALTLLLHLKSMYNIPSVQLLATRDAVDFWEKVGFIADKGRPGLTKMTLKNAVPFKPIALHK